MFRARVVALLLMTGASGLAAQKVRSDTSARGSLFNATSAWIAGGAGVGSVTLMLADPGITKALRRPALQRNRFLEGAASSLDWIGDPGTVILPAGLYAAGRLTHHPALAELGLRSAEAVLISGAATGLIKGVMGRDRPFLDEGDADDFRAGAGFAGAGHTSFPSGHATAAFAVASVVALESSDRWPHAARFVAPAVYGLAASVGLARIYGAHHWASDVVAGAGIGTLIGMSVVKYHRLHTRTWLDRWLLGARVVPTAGRGGVGLSLLVTTR